MSEPSQSKPEIAALKVWVEEAAAAEPQNVWITPHTVRVIRIPQSPPPKYRMIKLVPTGTGVAQVPVDWSALLKISSALMHELGIEISKDTLQRLIDGGFIKASRIVPGCTLLDLNSLHAHLTAATESAWWTQERRMRYSQAKAYGDLHDE
jgi:hypothetical protein